MHLPARSAAALALLFNAFAYGVFWWPLRELSALGVHPLWTTACIFIVACVATMPRLDTLRRFATQRGLWLVAISAGLANAAFNWGLVTGDIVRVVLLFYLMPAWASLFAYWFLDEKLTAAALFRVACAIGGAALVIYEPGNVTRTTFVVADLLGLAGGFFFALNTVMLRKTSDQPLRARALAMFSGALLIPGLLALALSVSGRINFPPVPVSGWIGFAAIVAVVYLIANLTLLYGTARLPANITATILVSEVLFAAVSAVFVAGDSLGPGTLAGGALILTAALLAARASQE